MVNALEQPDSGKVSVFGEPIPTQRLQQFRHRMGYAVQGAGLFPHLSAEDNITLVVDCTAGPRRVFNSALRNYCGPWRCPRVWQSDR